MGEAKALGKKEMWGLEVRAFEGTMRLDRAAVWCEN